jgi:hypothetical protein
MLRCCSSQQIRHRRHSGRRFRWDPGAASLQSGSRGCGRAAPGRPGMARRARCQRRSAHRLPRVRLQPAGPLKNAIDWVIGTGELERKIVGVTASARAQGPVEPLRAVSARIVGGDPIPRGPRFETDVAALVRVRSLQRSTVSMSNRRMASARRSAPRHWSRPGSRHSTAPMSRLSGGTRRAFGAAGSFTCGAGLSSFSAATRTSSPFLRQQGHPLPTSG